VNKEPLEYLRKIIDLQHCLRPRDLLLLLLLLTCPQLASSAELFASSGDWTDSIPRPAELSWNEPIPVRVGPAPGSDVLPALYSPDDMENDPPWGDISSSEMDFHATENESLPLKATFREGFGLESENRQFQLRIRVLNQVDGKLFAPTDQEPARSGLYIPRFRIYFEGQLTDLFEYELSLQRSVEGAFDVLDANINFVASEALQVRVGRALVPYSYSWYDHLEQFYITPERGLFPINFGLARQAGVFVHGKVWEERLQYAGGFTFGQLAGLADTNTTRDGMGYLNLKPFLHSSKFPALRFLNLGGSLSIGRQAYAAAPLPLRTSLQTSENDEAAQAASSIFLEYNDGVVAKGERLQGSLHLALYSGPFSIETEWFAARFGTARSEADQAVGIPVFGYDLTLAGFLTGERVEDRSAVVPLRPVTPRSGSGFGALEVFGRYSKLKLGQQIFSAGLANAADWANSAGITDIGCNWYLNRFVRLTFDWQHAMYATPVLMNESRDLHSRYDDLYWLRCQFYF
jgi:phosphate-selective porin OprO/OprP